MDKYNQYRSKANDAFNNMPLGMGLPFLSVDELRAYNHPTLANAADAVLKFLDPKGVNNTTNTNNSYVNNWEPKHIQQQAIMNLAQVQPQQAQQPQSPLQDIIAKANSGNTQGAIESARIYDKTQQPQSSLQNIQAQAIQQATQAHQSIQPQQSQQYTPLPKQMTGNQIDQMYKSGQHWTPEQEQALNIYTRVQNKEIQDPYKEGSMAYVINNLQGHGYNPQQIADYMQAQTRGNQQQQALPQNPYLSNLNTRLKDLSSEIYVARNSFDSERADILQKQYDQLLGTALQQGQQGINNYQTMYNAQHAGDLTESDKAKMQNNIDLQNSKNQGLLEATGLKAGTVKRRGLLASSAKELSSTAQGVQMMSDLESRLPQLSGYLTTPVMAQAMAMNPWSQEAQAFQQYVNTYKQIIGKGLEGGVLRKEDEIKYQKIIPKVGDTAETLAQKTQQLKDILANKYKTDLDFYNKAGYDTSQFAPELGVQRMQPTQQQNIDPLEAEMKRRGLL